MPTNYDAIVIGAGQAGPALAERLGKAGLKTAIVERHLLGGTCVNVGCIPTKTLVGGARVAWQALQAERIFINVGARARVADFPGLDQVDYLSNSSMMEVEFLPEHLLIVGGSYIGLEFGQMYRRFGSKVTIVEMQDRLIAREGEDVSAAVREILEGEGVTVCLSAECIGFEKGPVGVRMNVARDEDSTPLDASHVLLAVGQVPKTHDLGLEHAGIETNGRGFISVDDELRTSAEGIWALGEVNARGAFTHTSYNDFEIVAANLLNADERRVSDRIQCYGLRLGSRAAKNH